MNGTATGTAGLESVDASNAAEHPPGARDRAQDKFTAALQALSGCTRQEAQAARELIREGLAHLDETEEG